MSKKRSKDEEILLFAMKVVGPIVVAFIVAIGMDIASLFDWVGNSTPDGSGLLSEFEYEWYMLF